MVARYSSGEFWFLMWYFNIIKYFVVRWLSKNKDIPPMVVYPNIYPFMHTKDKKLLKLRSECATSKYDIYDRTKYDYWPNPVM
jgi:hypothetical protein